MTEVICQRMSVGTYCHMIDCCTIVDVTPDSTSSRAGPRCRRCSGARPASSRPGRSPWRSCRTARTGPARRTQQRYARFVRRSRHVDGVRIDSDPLDDGGQALHVADRAADLLEPSGGEGARIAEHDRPRSMRNLFSRGSTARAPGSTSLARWNPVEAAPMASPAARAGVVGLHLSLHTDAQFAAYVDHLQRRLGEVMVVVGNRSTATRQHRCPVGRDRREREPVAPWRDESERSACPKRRSACGRRSRPSSDRPRRCRRR